MAKAKFSKKIASIDDCMLNKRDEWWEGLATRSMEYQRSKRLAATKLRRRDQAEEIRGKELPISTGGPRRSYSTVNRAIEKLKKKNILPTSFVIKQDLVFHCPVDVVVTKNTFLPPEGDDGAQCSGCYPIVYWALPIPIGCRRLSTPSKGVSIHNNNDEEIVSSTKSPQGRRRPQTAQQAADHLKRTDARLAATCWHGWQRTRPLVDVGPLGVMFDFSCNFHRNRHTPKTIEIGLVGFALIFAAC